MEGLRLMLGDGPQLAYLSYMANRLLECHRVLKDTGSIYLHCDPTMSHYLKVVMDGIFGGKNFKNEITWKRTTAHSDVAQGAKHMGRIHDTLLRFSKGASPKWNIVYAPYDQQYIESTYRQKDETGRRYQTQPLHAAKAGGDTRYEWKREASTFRSLLGLLEGKHATPRCGRADLLQPDGDTALQDLPG